MFKILITLELYDGTQIVFKAIAANGQKTYSDVIHHHWDKYAQTKSQIFAPFIEEAKHVLSIPEGETIEFHYE